MKIVRRNPKIFHPLRFFFGLALLLAGLYFAIGLQSTVNYMGSSILFLMSLDAMAINFENWEIIAGAAMAVAGIVLLLISSSGNKPNASGKRRILVYRGVLWIGLLFVIFGSYILFDPSTGTDMVNGKIVQMFYLQLGAILDTGIRLWVGLALVLFGVFIASWFSFGREKTVEAQAPRIEEPVREDLLEAEPTIAVISVSAADAPNAAAPTPTVMQPVPVVAKPSESAPKMPANLPTAPPAVKTTIPAKPKPPQEKASTKDLESQLIEIERQIVKQKLMEKREKMASNASKA
ncbi:MAG: hypothetical protein PHH26_02380 [Candidatus Thermoplasmatota archaeon]|nr:hypothetical protein [Candidatus Thermoplasmatota archaeon]